MVDSTFIRKVLNKLEKYLIVKSGYTLLGKNYDLILLIPSDRYDVNAKYTLVLSSSLFDIQNQKDVIRDLLGFLKGSMTSDEYNQISRLNIVNSGDPFVKNVNFVFKFRNMFIEIIDYPVGGVKIDYAILLRSLILDKLVTNTAVSIRLRNGTIINVGIIRIEVDFKIICYTAKGLHEFKKGMKIEWDESHTMVIPYDEIDQVI